MVFKKNVTHLPTYKVIQRGAPLLKTTNCRVGFLGDVAPIHIFLPSLIRIQYICYTVTELWEYIATVYKLCVG